MIVALGNPGPDYEQTYHNCGFLMLDAMLAGRNLSWKNEAHYAVAQEEGVLYVKPSTFMNESGHAVGEAARYYRVSSTRIMVLHDDADITLGSYKVSQSGGSGGHHGIESIIAALGSNEFWRTKIGIRRPPDPDTPDAKRKPAMDIVLRPINAADMEVLQSVFTEAGKSARNVIEKEMP